MEITTAIDPRPALVEELENDLSIHRPDRLRERLEALDRLDACFPGAVPERSLVDGELERRARALRMRLEAVNLALYDAMRSEIRSEGKAEALLRWVDANEQGAELARGLGYDALDELIGGVLQLEEPDDKQIQRKPEMVFYQPTPARHIFSLIDQAALTASDVLVDLGSGLGHVPLLVSICTPARCIGIDLEPSYIEQARRCARGLNLSRVTFLAEDARVADLSSGSVFYLYTPFVGSILRCVLDRLRSQAAARQIRVCTYGPCTAVVAKEPWLEITRATETDRIAVFSSRRGAGEISRPSHSATMP